MVHRALLEASRDVDLSPSKPPAPAAAATVSQSDGRPDGEGSVSGAEGGGERREITEAMMKAAYLAQRQVGNWLRVTWPLWVE